MAVDDSADGNAAGYGLLNPALYLLAQQSPGTYLNDVTSGNNDYNGTAGGSYPAMTGYDMATGLGTPIVSKLAVGLTGIPLDVTVTGSQPYGGTTPTFAGSADYAGSGTVPFGVTLNTAGLSCTEVDTSTPIGPALSAGSHTVVGASCSGATLSGADATDYAIVYTSTTGDFTVSPAPLTITASSPTSTYGTTPVITPIYSGFKNNDGASSLTVPPTCSTTATSSSPPSPPTYQSSCSGAVGSNYTISYAPGVVTVDPAPLTITASSPTMTYGERCRTITPIYSGFKNNDGASSLTAPPTCSTTATSSSPPSPPTYPSSCSGARGPELHHQLCAGSGDGRPGPGRRRRLGRPDLREHHPDVLGGGQPTVGHHGAQRRPDLRRGRHLDADRSGAGGGQPHRGRSLVQRDDPLGHRCAPTTPPRTPARRGTSRSPRPR